MALRCVFGVMSATQSPAVVEQLAGLLAPHPVLIHHDFSKRADFRVSAPNACTIVDPRGTGWGTWGFSEAIFHTLAEAIRLYDFDYFQLLSPTCLPIRPLAEFEAFIKSSSAQAHIDLLRLDDDDDLLMTFGYRTFAPGNSQRFRLLRRVRHWYFDNQSQLVQRGALSVLKHADGPDAKGLGLPARAGLVLTRMARDGALGPHPFDSRVRPMIGGVFFGARREVCEYLVGRSHDESLLGFIRRLYIVDETLFATLLGNSGFAIGPSNHAVNAFTETGSPRWIESGDFDRLAQTGRFFARKFADDPESPMRQRAIRQVRQSAALHRPAGRLEVPVHEPASAHLTLHAVRPAAAIPHRLQEIVPRQRPQTPRIVFAVMSSQQPDDTVSQLVDALAPCPVVIHHDFTKRQDFSIVRDHLQFVPDPKQTGWGTWGFADAIFHTLEYALERHDFDYFQLLSPTCLPIRPIADFAAHIAAADCEIQADVMPIDADDDVLMTFGYRTYVRDGTLRFRMMRRARAWYFGDRADLVQMMSLSILRRGLAHQSVFESIAPRTALAFTRMVVDGQIAEHPFGSALRPMIGSIWFGARRPVCEYLVRLGRDPAVRRYFSRLHVVDETLFPTLLANSPYRVGASNHTISPFDMNGHPRRIEALDVDALRDTGRFFARKFSDDPTDPVRRRALALARTEPILVGGTHVDSGLPSA